MRARDYSHLEGGFTSVDPLPQLRGRFVAPYVYAAANPTTNIDPSGLHIDVKPCPCNRCIGRYVVGPDPRPDPLAARVKEACARFDKCYTDTACRLRLIACVSKYYSPGAALMLQCMHERCSPSGPNITIACDGDQIICAAFSACAYPDVGGGSCTIHICTEQKNKRCDPDCNHFSQIATCHDPKCEATIGTNTAWTVLHEISHCCGTTDADRQAAKIEQNCFVLLLRDW